MNLRSSTWIFLGVIVVIAVPLAFRWVPPNPWYGVRLGASVSKVADWYRVNQFAGAALLAGAALGACTLRLTPRVKWLAPAFPVIALAIGVALALKPA